MKTNVSDLPLTKPTVRNIRIIFCYQKFLMSEILKGGNNEWAHEAHALASSRLLQMGALC